MAKFTHGDEYIKIENEIFKPVSEYEGLYEISNLGRIKSLPRLGSPRITIMKLSNDDKGYPQTALTKNKKSKTFKVHRLVATAFLNDGGESINHKNGIKTDNRVENLEWCSRSYNVQHAYDNGLKFVLPGMQHPMSKLMDDDVIEMRRLYKEKKHTLCELANKFNTAKSNVVHIVKERHWKHLL